MQRRSTIVFLMTLPLIVLILVLVAYPAGYAVYLAMLNKGMTRFVGLGNFAFLFAERSCKPDKETAMVSRKAFRASACAASGTGCAVRALAQATMRSIVLAIGCSLAKKATSG
jgi:ABC-type sugar transport system permease subunit